MTLLRKSLSVTNPTNSPSASSFQLNFASLVFPFSVGKTNIVGGVAYRRVLDFTNEFEINAEAFGMQQMVQRGSNLGFYNMMQSQPVGSGLAQEVQQPQPSPINSIIM